VKNTLLFIIGIIFSCKVLVAQKEANIWYFGRNAGIDFNSGAPVALTNGMLSTVEASATISDKNTGNLLFYTDGNTVFDKNHSQMPNGFGLAGDLSSTQSIIVPWPGNANKYYIFTVQDENSVSHFANYSVVDISLNNGFGDVTVKNTFLDSMSCEKIAAVRHTNCTDIWVVFHENDTSNFKAYLITSAGVSAPVISTTGSINNYEPGFLRFSPDGSKLASAVVYLSVELFDFNRTTGVVSNPLLLMNSIINFPSYGYGVEFSPDNTRLYVSVPWRGTPDIFQFNLLAGTPAGIVASKTTIKRLTPGLDPGAMQIAPDGKIYVAEYKGSGTHPFLGVINLPNQLGTACNFIESGFNLAGRSSELGLPNFIQSYFSPMPNLSVSNDTTVCSGSLVTLTAMGNGTFQWSIGSTAASIVVAPSAYTTYSVIANSNCFLDTAIVTVSVVATPTVTVLGNTSICRGDSSLISAAGGGSYTWSTGSSTQIISVKPTSSSSYSVVVSNGICSSWAQINISVDQMPQLFVSNDTAICAGESVLLTASGASGYSWNTGSTASFLFISPLSQTSYTVIAANGNCFVTDSIEVFVNVIPIANAGTNSTITPGSEIVLNASGGGSYSWYPSAGLNCITCNDPMASPVISTTYYLLVIDSNGCTNLDSVIITVDDRCGEFYIPTAFSPNGDGQNDIYFIKGNYCIKDLRFTIYDRWGAIVFETTDPAIGWDGVYNTKQLDAAVFTYRMDALLINGGQMVRKGNITLVK